MVEIVTSALAGFVACIGVHRALVASSSQLAQRLRVGIYGSGGPGEEPK